MKIASFHFVTIMLFLVTRNFWELKFTKEEIASGKRPQIYLFMYECKLLSFRVSNPTSFVAVNKYEKLHRVS